MPTTPAVIAPKKLIEVALPLDAINVAAAREKSIRHGHPSTLHLWWARRPLAAARAVIFAQLVHDPEDLWRCRNPGKTPNAQDKGHWTRARAKLFTIIEDLVKWENTTNEAVLEPARAEIRKAWREACELNRDHPQASTLFDPDKMPGLHDPFAGGGTIPLEAQRLGLEAHASDLNPVAVLINKAMIEIPPKFAGRPPVKPESRATSSGAQASRLHFDEGTTSSGAQASRLHFDTSSGAQASRLHFDEGTWRSRGYLPHFDRPGLIQSITFRLADSLPQAFLRRCEEELMALPEKDRPRARDQRIAAWLDQGEGACHLRDPRIAEIVENALLHFDRERYDLIAWCVMPNHVHVMIETKPGHSLEDVLHSWKSFTSKEAGKILKRSGTFWQPEYHDRFIRDDEHFARARRYIEENPVKAGFVATAAEWRWSSAWQERRAGGTPALPVYSGARGLAEDVRYYGKWMRDEAFKRIGHLYPPVAVTAEMAQDRPDLAPYVGEKLTVIAWLWARTVKSPNPAFSHVDVPLASTFILSSKEGKEAYVQPVIGKDGYTFTVKVGKPPAEAEEGTKAARGNFRCLMSQAPIDGNYLRAEGMAGRMSQKLMAIVAEGSKGRVYLSPITEQATIADAAAPTWKPDVKFFQQALGFRIANYGMTKWSDLFTNRQLVALTTFSELVAEARERIRLNALKAGMLDDERGIDAGGIGATAYSDAVSLYLGLAVSKETVSLVTQARWRAGEGKSAPAFGRQALPIVWDFADLNPFAGAGGDFEGILVLQRQVVPA